MYEITKHFVFKQNWCCIRFHTIVISAVFRRLNSIIFFLMFEHNLVRYLTDKSNINGFIKRPHPNLKHQNNTKEYVTNQRIWVKYALAAFSSCVLVLDDDKRIKKRFVFWLICMMRSWQVRQKLSNYMSTHKHNKPEWLRKRWCNNKIFSIVVKAMFADLNNREMGVIKLYYLVYSLIFLPIFTDFILISILNRMKWFV